MGKDRDAACTDDDMAQHVLDGGILGEGGWIASTCVPFNAISLQIPRTANDSHLRLFVQEVVIDAPRLGVHIDKGDPADLLVVLIWCCEVEIPS